MAKGFKEKIAVARCEDVSERIEYDFDIQHVVDIGDTYENMNIKPKQRQHNH